MPLAILLLLIAIVSIQSGASLAKQLFPIVGAQGTTALRLGFAALMLSLLWRPWNAKGQPLTRREMLFILMYGVALGGMNYSFYLALERIPLGIAVAIEFTGPLAVAFVSSRKAIDFLWAALAAAGIALILPLRETSASVDLAGMLLALLAGGFWALYIVFGQKAGSSVHGGRATTLGMIVASLVACPFGIAHAGSSLLSLAILPAALGVAFFSSALPYSLEMTALKRMPAKTFGILMSLEPAVAALAGLVFLGERLAAAQWLAIGFIILASLGTSLSAKPSAAAAEAAP